MEPIENTKTVANTQSIGTIPSTLMEAVRQFGDPLYCVQLVALQRWPDGVTCPYCSAKEPGFLSTRLIFKCRNRNCRKQFSVKAGSIFEDSPLGLDKWLTAAWMIGNCKNGISSYEIARGLGVTQKTAWFMLHRIRHVMETGSFEKTATMGAVGSMGSGESGDGKSHSGVVEVDETFVGGLAKNMHKAERARKIKGTGGAGKAVVLGILERSEQRHRSRVKTTIIPDRTATTLQAAIKDVVVPGSEVMTDAHAGYRGLSEAYRHQIVDHAVQFVTGRVSTNGLENFWSLTKRALRGTYVSVEPEHLMAYLSEQTFRFNERSLNDAGRFLTVLGQIGGKRLTYHELIGSPNGEESPDPLRGGRERIRQ